MNILNTIFYQFDNEEQHIVLHYFHDIYADHLFKQILKFLEVDSFDFNDKLYIPKLIKLSLSLQKYLYTSIEIYEYFNIKIKSTSLVQKNHLDKDTINEIKVRSQKYCFAQLALFDLLHNYDLYGMKLIKLNNLIEINDLRYLPKLSILQLMYYLSNKEKQQQFNLISEVLNIDFDKYKEDISLFPTDQVTYRYIYDQNVKFYFIYFILNFEICQLKDKRFLNILKKLNISVDEVGKIESLFNQLVTFEEYILESSFISKRKKVKIDNNKCELINLNKDYFSDNINIYVNGFLNGSNKSFDDWGSFDDSSYGFQWPNTPVLDILNPLSGDFTFTDIAKEVPMYILNTPFKLTYQMLKCKIELWKEAYNNAEKYSIKLAEHIEKFLKRKKKINLYGHSLGAKLIFHTLLHLYEKRIEINNVYLLGGAVNSECDSLWDRASSVVNNKIYNFYLKKEDWSLNLYRLAELGEKPIGLYPINNSRVYNYNVGGIVNGHTNYKESFSDIIVKYKI